MKTSVTSNKIIKKKIYKCKRCKLPGHNITTCTNVLPKIKYPIDSETDIELPKIKYPTDSETDIELPKNKYPTDSETDVEVNYPTDSETDVELPKIKYPTDFETDVEVNPIPKVIKQKSIYNSDSNNITLGKPKHNKKRGSIKVHKSDIDVDIIIEYQKKLNHLMDNWCDNKKLTLPDLKIYFNIEYFNKMSE